MVNFVSMIIRRKRNFHPLILWQFENIKSKFCFLQITEKTGYESKYDFNNIIKSK